MGEVYRARDERLGREVAVKVLPAESSTEPDRLRRFEQEARAAGALNHPNLLAVLDTGRHEGNPYIVFELLDGKTLRQALGHAALPLRKAVDYAVQIAEGLAAAHEKGIVHRDLKPENLFVTRDDRVKILDFGLAKLRPELDADAAGASTLSATTGAGVVLGTVGYMSPEQVRGEPADHRSDIFCFGAVLYEMLSGRRPFTGETSPEPTSPRNRDGPRSRCAASLARRDKS
jgi:serine/threonine protein kinase